jgi:hypothetical protein
VITKVHRLFVEEKNTGITIGNVKNLKDPTKKMGYCHNRHPMLEQSQKQNFDSIDGEVNSFDILPISLLRYGPHETL